MVKNKEGSFRLIVIVMIASIFIAFNWDKWAWLKDGVHSVFNPSLGALLDWNMTIGMLIILFILAVVLTLLQKYTTDQDELKKIKKDQKEIQKQMKKLKDHPEKMMALQKEQFKMMPKQMKLGMRTIVYTSIPFILLFRWFSDYFLAIEAATGEAVRFMGFFSWFWFYFIGFMIFSMILKKKFDIV